MANYAQRRGLTAVMKTFPKDTPFVGLDLDALPSKIFVGVVFIFLLATGGANIGLSYAVQHKVNQVKASLSKQTFQMQKALTKVLVAQVSWCLV